MPRKRGYHIRSARLEQATESWWTTATPEHFTDTAMTEASRMALSRFGRTQLTSPNLDWSDR